jgi:serine/threonine protein kinase
MKSGSNPPASNRPMATRAIDLQSPDDGGFELRVDPDEQSLLPVQQLEKDKETRLPVFGEYLVQEKIGAGGMGQVFRARHRTMDREVALKILPRSLSADPEAINRFYREVRATAKLMHPNIVTAFDAGCFKAATLSVHFLVMELIRGDLLSTRIAQHGPMSTKEVVDILAQASSALEYAHNQGIVHRDIKPSNMMMTQQGVLKILDFGLAVLRDKKGQTEEQESPQIIGTVEFMSPEQINEPNKVDHRSDLYSLGATIFYLLTGRPMFQGEVVQTALAQVHRKPPALYEVRGDVDLRLDSIFQSLVAKNPYERLQSAHELTEKLIKLNLLDRSTMPQNRPTAIPSRVTPIRPTSVGPDSTSQNTYAAVGIELGMLNSRVSYVNRDHKIEEVLVDGESAVTRNLLYSDGESIAVGARAVDLRVQKPECIFHGMQRWYGLPLLERPFGGRQVPPEVLVACVMRQMMVATRHELPNASHAVVTVPACYDQMHRLCTKVACSIAGVEVLQLLDKPVAAALAHNEIEVRLAKGSGSPMAKKHLVVMLNGAACEAALVQVEGDEIRLLAAEGDWKRGFVRWHDRAAKKVAALIEQKFGASAKDDRQVASRIQRTLERAFEKLRFVPSVPFIVEVAGGRFESKIDRDNLAEWVDELVNDCGFFVKKLLERTNTDPRSIESILLSGAASWVPSIRQQIQGMIGKHAKTSDISSADLARGAAVQAHYMMPPTKADCPHAVSSASYDLGVIIQDDTAQIPPPRILIPRDQKLPTSLSKTLRFSKDGRKQPTLQFVEGSRVDAFTWNRLGWVDLQKCFAARNSADPLQLRIEIDESGLWSGAIAWPAGNDQVALSPLSIPMMDVVSIRQWRDWLESLMLCNG